MAGCGQPTTSQRSPADHEDRRGPRSRIGSHHTLNRNSTTSPRLITYAVIIAHAAARTNLHG
ncbi:hypothetical protein ACFOLD_14995 [Kocuria carniphila]|uniref:hypothetical protein n=1 Tax=Kocuria carniphila TaxID=262208 RepID=UPI00360E5170